MTQPSPRATPFFLLQCVIAAWLFFLLFHLENGCFTVLFVSAGQQWDSVTHVDTSPLFFGFPSHLDHSRAPSRVSCAIQSVPTCYLFIHSSVCMLVRTSNPSHPPLPLAIHMFVLHNCGSISVWQINSSIYGHITLYAPNLVYLFLITKSIIQVPLVVMVV